MKRKVVKSIACLLFIGMAWSCSSESDTVMSDSAQKGFIEKSGGSVWDDVIAEEVSGQVTIVADEATLIDGLEAAAGRQTPNESVKISNLSIVRKTAANDPGDSSYFLVGNGQSVGGGTVSVGVPLTATFGGGKLFLDPGFSVGAGSSKEPKPVSCWGCGTGCFLEYYNVDGHKVPYCNAAGCGPICTKKED